MGFFAAILWSVPVMPFVEWFDERTLPPVQLEDLQQFHDATLAMKHGATSLGIDRHLAQLESRWWDTAGFEHEYQKELQYLRWAKACWERLEIATNDAYTDGDRLNHLNTLRRLLGPTPFYVGRMPDYPSEALCLRP